jgi:hypothetical protein
MRHPFTVTQLPTRWYPSVGGDACPAMGRLASNLIARQEKSG